MGLLKVIDSNNNNEIEIKTVSFRKRKNATRETLFINDCYYVKKNDHILYSCDETGEVCKSLFKYDDKFFQEKIYSPNIQRKKTNLIKYGYETPREEIKKSIKEKYGVENISQIESVKQKRKQTFIDKYNVENSFQLKETKEKIKKSIHEKYGVDFNLQREDVKKNRWKNHIDSIFNGKRVGSVTPLFSKNEYKGKEFNHKWKCDVCDTVFYDNIDDGSRPNCPTCFPDLFKQSKMENEIYDFIRQYIKNIDKNSNILGRQELDIYLPDHNIAIEFDGLYWHSDLYKDKNYHLNKTRECEKLGIQLIHIFEDEWLVKQEIVKSRLKNLLGLNSRRIGARQVTIKEIDSKTKNKFLTKYHIQGEDRSSIKLGAYYNNELIGVMTFSKPRVFMGKKITKDTWELSRFATISDTYTPGLASRMLTHFERNYKPRVIESFADRRWSQGNLYYKLGFEFIHQTEVNYYYFINNKKRYHRYNFRKSELKNFENYSPEKTEKQIMDEAGYLRIYDCGNYKFIKNINSN